MMQRLITAAQAVPEWMSKVVVTALVGALIAGGFAWASNTGAKVAEHDKKIAVQEERSVETQKDISEIKQDTRDIKALLMRRR